MIKINLAKKKRAGFAGSQPTSGLTTPSIDLEELKQLPLAGMGFLILTYLGGSYWIDHQKDQMIQEVENQIRITRQEEQKLRVELGRTAGFQKQKQEFEENEFTIRTKIETIDKLLAGRSASLDMLTFLSSALPQDVWLSRFGLEAGKITLIGFAPEFKMLAEFQKKIAESIFFSEVDPKRSKQEVQRGVEVYSFEILAKTRQQEDL